MGINFKALCVASMYVVATSLCSCNNSAKDISRKLSVSDLKFPPLYEIALATELPRPNRDYIKRNYVRSVFSFPEVGKMNEYSPNLVAIYKEARQLNESFTEWFWRHTGTLDSSCFDEEGHMLEQRRNCLMCGVTRYKYDSLGFISIYHIGGCVIRDYRTHYYWNVDEHDLYYCDTSVKFSANEGVTKLHFDSSGYLDSRTYKNFKIGYSTVTRYEYDARRRIVKVERRDSIAPRSERDKEPGSPVTGAISQYYYTTNYPDSIITGYRVDNQQNIHHTQKIYFDSTGLPVKSVYINFPTNRRRIEIRRYRYHKF